LVGNKFIKVRKVKKPPELLPDGERYLPQFAGTIELEHLHRYQLARRIAAGLDVLDIACGEGYGTKILMGAAKSVIGVDISAAAVEHAAFHYPDPNVSFRVGGAKHIPVSDDAVDMIVSFETIEHLVEHEEMLLELKRVLRPGGVLLISSPSKLEYSDKPGYSNPFHVRELYTEEFIELIGRHFTNFKHFGQRLSAASLIANDTDSAPFFVFAGNESQPGVPEARYDLILASDDDLPDFPHSAYEIPQSTLQPYVAEAYRASSEAYRASAEEQIAGLITTRDQISAQVRELGEKAQQAEARVANLEQQLAARHGELEQHLAAHHVELEQHLAAHRAEVELWARQSEALEIWGAQYQARAAEAEGHLNTVVGITNSVLTSKWWRRSRVFRRWTNSLRKRRGQPKKYWPTRVEMPQLSAVTERPSALPRPQEPVSHHDETPQQLVETHTPERHQEEWLTYTPLSGVPAPFGRSVVDVPDVPIVPYSDIDEGFVPYTAHEPFLNPDVRAIAFYLPQFHPFAENDAWWGKGFTEWTNVGKAKPLFPGHHQPHCPIHLGYYDLRVAEIMREQARLARNYGISGFAYYFYWFAGKLLMQSPLEKMLEDPEVDIPFCMIWANENWTRRWDGADHEVLIAQDHSFDDSRAMIEYLFKFMMDPRYIRIDGKPLLIIYHSILIPDFEETVALWQKEARQKGFDGLYVVSAQTFGFRPSEGSGLDAVMEFPPHGVNVPEVSGKVPGLTQEFSGKIYDYSALVGNEVIKPEPDYRLFRTSFLSWDNTARRGKKSHVFTDFSLTRYGQWLAANLETAAKDETRSADERIVFINAWNEWAEGTHLEPDSAHGYGYLDATRKVLANYDGAAGPFQRPAIPETTEARYAVIAHVHYAQTWPELQAAIESLPGVDVYVTTTTLETAQFIADNMPRAIVEIVDNRGRDVRPFLMTMQRLAHLNYKAVCKVHGKKSAYRTDGDTLRQQLTSTLLKPSVIEMFEQDDELGLVAAESSMIAHNAQNMTYGQALVDAISAEIGIPFRMGRFPAGTMFWASPQAIAPLTALNIRSFDVERGLADGTRAHAIERLFATVTEARGFSIQTL
jgi:lipopolysaccharide biosynthesis protein/SAM-dependent methyltransferase